MAERNRAPHYSLCGTLLLSLACYLTSCAPQKIVVMPGSQEERLPPRPQTSAPAPPPQRASEPEAAIPPPVGRAGTLFLNANKAIEAGRLDRAELQLERALRLAPREPQIWHAMATLRFAQGNYAQAVQFCLKSNSLAGKQRAIRRQNWLLLEKAYLKMGQQEKAAYARRQAEGATSPTP